MPRRKQLELFATTVRVRFGDFFCDGCGLVVERTDGLECVDCQTDERGKFALHPRSSCIDAHEAKRGCNPQRKGGVTG
jgi:hypothetical protein